MPGFIGDFQPSSRAKVWYAASTNVQFGGKNSDKRQSRPLSPPEISKELGARVLQGWLNAFDGRKRQWNLVSR
jgi:hypothetical protein